MKSEGGATLRELDDHSILAAGKNPPQDVYTVTFRELPARIEGLRLEALLHESLPKGPGRGAPDHGDGNFLLTTLKAQLDLPTSKVEPRILKMAKAYADFSFGAANVTGAIDANDKTGWGIYPEVGKAHQAIFDFAEPVALTDGAVLRVTLEFKSGVPQHQLGRFRLSTSEDPAVFARERHRFLPLKLVDPWARLAAAFRIIGDQHALDKLLERQPEAAVGLGDLYAADQDWERAIIEYRKLVTDLPADGSLISETRHGLPVGRPHPRGDSVPGDSIRRQSGGHGALPEGCGSPGVVRPAEGTHRHRAEDPHVLQGHQQL